MKYLKQNVCAFISAMIWGTAFVAQSVCSEHIGPFTTTALRSVIAAVFLTVVVFLKRKVGRKKSVFKDKIYFKKLLSSGIVCGIILSMATILQQTGIGDTGAGKTAFITAMYVVIVPVLGIFFKKKAGRGVWTAVAVAVIGFYFLCLHGDGGISLAVSDLFVLLCAFMFSVHIIVVDNVSDGVDGIELSCIQFYTASLLSLIFMLAYEKVIFLEIAACLLPLMYIGVFSSGIAYTLQIMAQKGSNPTVISLILALESVFAVLAEHIIGGTNVKSMTWWEILGCALIFSAVLLSQIPFNELKKICITKKNREGESLFF